MRVLKLSHIKLRRFLIYIYLGKILIQPVLSNSHALRKHNSSKPPASCKHHKLQTHLPEVIPPQHHSPGANGNLKGLLRGALTITAQVFPQVHLPGQK